MQLDLDKLEIVLDGVRERICQANRNDTLLSLLDGLGWGDLLPFAPEDGFYSHPTGQIVVLGDSEVKKDKLLGIAKSLGISKDRVELCLGYKELIRYDYRKLQYAPHYRLVLVGPMPHKTAGSGDFSSAVSAMQQPGSGYPKVEKLLAGNELKITKTSFSGALQKLLDEGFLKAG